MTTTTFLRGAAAAALLLLGVGCAGVERARARDELASLRESVRLAEMRGVGRDPRSAEQLGRVRLEVRESQQWLEADPVRAQSSLARARADLELATALEEEGRARAEDRRISRQAGAAMDSEVVR